ncbi:MAG: DUF6036 family nucleotidyltransferase [Oscillospiraceae bacterium]|nr:DUF6036 family nucleotidyltransferase [Oscillospiraceae bacterium]
MVELSKKELLERLKSLDVDAELLFHDEGKYHVFIAGGGALILMEYTSRATSDIDVIDASKALYKLFDKYQMNGHIAAHINSFLFNYEDRVELILKGEKIDFYTISLEDIVVSKLCAGRPPDWDDLKVVSKHVDWEKLEMLVSNDNEISTLKMSFRHYSEFMHAYERYMEEFKP